MKTPLDGAIRMRRRELDEMRSALNEALSAMDAAANQKIALMKQTAEEIAIAAGDWTLPVRDFYKSTREHMARLDAKIAQCSAQVETLREALRDAFASLRALENAAERHRDEALLTQDRAAQNEADDFAINGHRRNAAFASSEPTWR